LSISHIGNFYLSLESCNNIKIKESREIAKAAIIRYNSIPSLLQKISHIIARIITKDKIQT